MITQSQLDSQNTATVPRGKWKITLQPKRVRCDKWVKWLMEWRAHIQAESISLSLITTGEPNCASHKESIISATCPLLVRHNNNAIAHRGKSKTVRPKFCECFICFRRSRLDWINPSTHPLVPWRWWQSRHALAGQVVNSRTGKYRIGIRRTRLCNVRKFSYIFVPNSTQIGHKRPWFSVT